VYRILESERGAFFELGAATLRKIPKRRTKKKPKPNLNGQDRVLYLTHEYYRASQKKNQKNPQKSTRALDNFLVCF
jgi:hypothetical protein